MDSMSGNFHVDLVHNEYPLRHVPLIRFKTMKSIHTTSTLSSLNVDSVFDNRLLCITHRKAHDALSQLIWIKIRCRCQCRWILCAHKSQTEQWKSLGNTETEQHRPLLHTNTMHRRVKFTFRSSPSSQIVSRVFKSQFHIHSSTPDFTLIQKYSFGIRSLHGSPLVIDLTLNWNINLHWRLGTLFTIYKCDEATICSALRVERIVQSLSLFLQPVEFGIFRATKWRLQTQNYNAQPKSAKTNRSERIPICKHDFIVSPYRLCAVYCMMLHEPP